MTSRRTFLAGAASAYLTPSVTWADAGKPSYLAAAKLPNGSYRLCGLDRHLKVVFSLQLPDRGHAAAAHPYRPEAVAFARRPGTSATVINCASGHPTATLRAPPERHFYGHGVFSADGSRLYTTENAYEIGQGIIGVWAADASYRRIGEFPSGGVGPHDIARLPSTDTLVVANGGIDTHPSTGREKLNLPTMQSNISFMSSAGVTLEVKTLPEDFRMNSMRHLAVRADGLIAFGCQWQGDIAAAPPLVGLCRIGSDCKLLQSAHWADAALDGYIGSIAFSGTGQSVAATAPRGNRILYFDPGTETQDDADIVEDVCGVSTANKGFLFTSGTGQIGYTGHASVNHYEPAAWDNHVVKI